MMPALRRHVILGAILAFAAILALNAQATTTLYTESWEGGLGGWNTASGISRLCGGSVDGSCYMNDAPPCCSSVVSSSKSVSLAMNGVTTVSFFFWGSATSGDTDANFYATLDSGETFTYSITGGARPNNNVFVNTQSSFASWGSSGTWYEGRLVFNHTSRQAHGELYTNTGTLVGKGANLAYSNSASQITQLRLDGVMWTGASMSFRFDKITVSMEPTQPSAPQNFNAAGGQGSIALTWQAPAQNGGAPVTSYNVYRGTSASNLQPITEGGCSSVFSTSCTDSGFGWGVTRYYAVAAVNSAGEGAKTTVKPATTLPFPSNPSSTRCDLQFSQLPGQNAVLPNQWNLPASSTGVSWRSTSLPTQDLAHDAQGHIMPARLWYTSQNLGQENYQAGSNGDLPNSGTATTAQPVTIPDQLSRVYFSSRYDIEARDPAARDQMLVEASGDGGASWAFLCKVNPTTSPFGTPDESVCSNGTPQGAYPCPRDASGSPTPAWETRSVQLPYAPGGYPLLLRFKFDTIDGQQNAGLGWMVTDVQIAP